MNDPKTKSKLLNWKLLIQHILRACLHKWDCNGVVGFGNSIFLHYKLIKNLENGGVKVKWMSIYFACLKPK